MNETTNKYKIQFVKKCLIDGYVKTMCSSNECLDQFITDYKTADDINYFLLNRINKVINGVSAGEMIISESMVTVIAAGDTTDLYFDLDSSLPGQKEFSLPTNDLRIIVEAWLAYVSS